MSRTSPALSSTKKMWRTCSTLYLLVVRCSRGRNISDNSTKQQKALFMSFLCQSQGPATPRGAATAGGKALQGDCSNGGVPKAAPSRSQARFSFLIRSDRFGGGRREDRS